MQSKPACGEYQELLVEYALYLLNLFAHSVEYLKYKYKTAYLHFINGATGALYLRKSPWSVSISYAINA